MFYFSRNFFPYILCCQPLSAVSEHRPQCPIRDVQILDRQENWHRRNIKEAINIRKGKPSLNRDIGQELPPVMHQLVSCDMTVKLSPLKKAERQPKYTEMFLER